MRNKLSYNKFSENLVGIEMKEMQTVMNKPVYLGISILGFSKILMHEFPYDFVKAKCSEEAKLFYMNTSSLIVHIEKDDISKDIAENVETRIDTSNY